MLCLLNSVGRQSAQEFGGIFAKALHHDVQIGKGEHLRGPVLVQKLEHGPQEGKDLTGRCLRFLHINVHRARKDAHGIFDIHIAVKRQVGDILPQPHDLVGILLAQLPNGGVRPL